MEDVLDVYQRPYDPQCPVVCMDESNKQLSIETRAAIPAGPGQVRCEDGEWKRNGVADVFMFVEPLKGRRFVSVTETRGAVDWAHQVKDLLTHYQQAPRICLVMDNLNTHDTSSLYKAFPAEEARALAERLEIHYTPKHGSWLNVAECELSVLCRQCLDRRIPDIETMRREVENWTTDRNRKTKKVDWQFTTADARIKLKHLYPQI
jgi:transposase